MSRRKEKKINEQFHLVVKKGEVRRLTPWLGGELFKQDRHFYPSIEKRQFLEKLGMPFAMATIDDPHKAIEIIDCGYENWHVAGGFVRDEGTILCMLPGASGLEDKSFYDALGMNVELTKWSDSFKVGKYMKRLWSHHPRYLEGELLQSKDDKLTVRLRDGNLISVRYVKKMTDEVKSITEGMNLVSSRFLKMIGFRPYREGTGIRVTASSPLGFTKGHAIAREDLRFDLVLYETKELLKSKEGRFVFALDELHPGGALTDVQSVVNFQLYDKPFLREWSFKFMQQVFDHLNDEEELKSMLSFYRDSFHFAEHEDGSMDEGDYITKEKEWALLRALRAGVPVTEYPSLRKKYWRLFTSNIMSLDGKVRIPIQPEVGGARYVMVDPTIFDEWGDPSKKGVLQGNEVYCPNHTGPVVFHRQPNAHRMEHHEAVSVQPLYPKIIDTDNFMFISRDVIASVMKKLGGGDQDDRVIYYTDQSVVEHFRQLPSYPLIDVPKDEAPARRENSFYSPEKPAYKNSQIKVMLAKMSESRVHIGQAVNPIIHDTLYSDCAEWIIMYLRENGGGDPRVPEAIAYMEELIAHPYKNAIIASQLESIIDGVKRDGSDVSAVADHIKKYYQELQVVEESFTKGGKFEGRLPQSRRGENMPVIVRTPLNYVIADIASKRAELEDAINLRDWAELRDSIPEEILTEPRLNRHTWELAHAIQRFYFAELERLVRHIDRETQLKKWKEAIDLVDQNVYDRFKTHPDVVYAMLELYIMIYTKEENEAPIDKKTGRPRNFPDGRLWGPRMSAWMIQALDVVGLTKRMVKVVFYDDCKHYAHGEHDVVINEGIVMLAGTEDQIGMVDTIHDGFFTMRNGLFQTATEDALPEATVAPEDTARTHVFATVVGGHNAAHRTTPEVEAWKARVHEPVLLEPYVFQGEHAVRVLIQRKDDQTKWIEYGHISKKENAQFTKPADGWLLPTDEEKIKEDRSYWKTVTVMTRKQ